jgi:hypothetical protein
MIELPLGLSAPLLTLNLLAAAVWVGSLAALAVVTRAARETLEPRMRVAFFRALGRRYRFVGGGSLVLAIGTGWALLADGEWTGTLSVLAALTAALMLTTIAGMAQARRVNRLRERQWSDPAATPDAGAITRHAARAAALRGAIALITLAIVIVTATYVSSSSSHLSSGSPHDRQDRCRDPIAARQRGGLEVLRVRERYLRHPDPLHRRVEVIEAGLL